MGLGQDYEADAGLASVVREGVWTHQGRMGLGQDYEADAGLASVVGGGV